MNLNRREMYINIQGLNIQNNDDATTSLLITTLKLIAKWTNLLASREMQILVQFSRR